MDMIPGPPVAFWSNEDRVKNGLQEGGPRLNTSPTVVSTGLTLLIGAAAVAMVLYVFVWPFLHVAWQQAVGR